MRQTCWLTAALAATFAAAFAAGCLRADGDATAATVAHFRDFARTRRVNGMPEGWTTWAPRSEIAPVFDVDTAAGRRGGGALRIRGAGNAAAIGSWRRRIEGVRPGRTYRFTAWYRAEGVPFAQRSIAARLDWLNARGERARPPDYVLDAETEGGWTRVEHVAAAPEGASAVVVELSLAWAPKGTVWWDDITFEEESAGRTVRDRTVRVLTVGLRPQGTKSAAESVGRFCRLAEEHAAERPDVVCLPEGISAIGTGKSYVEVAEPVPGPTTARLGALAARLHSYVCAGLYERVGPVVYNTAVLMGREGQLVGAYRKTHLPREEVEGGLTPGDSYPVFQTDFGKVGLLICWDVQFPEPARAMGLRGAEMILLPIAGGSDVLARARAIENHLFLVSASYDMRTFVVAPDGQVLAEAAADHPWAVAELHLDRKIVQPWLGDMKARTWKERRPDIPVERP